MGMKDKRTILKLGKYSNAITIPSKMKVGDSATLAGNRLIIMDPRGEIHEDDLLQFLEKFVEPNFWPWIEKKEETSANEAKADP